MNKKFFSALLMGSLLLGGTFVSCSDYDDDIKNLQEQINNLATKSDVEARLSQLQSALTSAQSTATEALAAAKAADNTAEVKALQTKLADIETALAAVKSAQEAVSKEVADQLAAFDEATKKAIADAQKKTEETVGKVADYVTAVDFLYDGDDNNGLYVYFENGKIGANKTFGKDEKTPVDGVKVNAKSTVTYKRNEWISFIGQVGSSYMYQSNNIYYYEIDGEATPSSPIVRVSPANAVITPDMVQIVNGKGENLDIVEVVDVRPFKGLITRGVESTGLYEIDLKLVAGVDQDKFDAKAEKNGGDIAYAVVVNNTSTAAERNVISDFQMYLGDRYDYTGETSLATVEIQSVETMDEAETLENIKGRDAAPNVARSSSASPVPAKNGEKINISFPAGYKAEYFFVVRDDVNLEKDSQESEKNAWDSYQYTGLGEICKVVDGTDITVTIPSSLTVGDEVAFRIYACNYDGTLVDENGESFCVYVGKNQNEITVAGNIVAINSSDVTTGWLPIEGKLVNGVALPSTLDVEIADGTTITLNVTYAKDNKGTAAAKNEEIKFAQFTAAKADYKTWEDNKKVVSQIVTTDSNNMKENVVKVTLTKVLPDAETTKKMMGYSWKAGQLVNGVYTAYLYPDADAWTTANAASGYKNMTQAINGLNGDAYIHVAKAAQKKNDADNKYYWQNTLEALATDFKLSVDNTAASGEPNVKLIDNSTEREMTIGYNYGEISSDDDKNDYMVDVETVKIVFACPLDTKVQTLSWTKYEAAKTNTLPAVSKDVNVITYGADAYEEKAQDGTTVLNLADFLIAKNSFDNTVFGGKFSAVAPAYYVSAEAKLTSNETGNVDYFDVTIASGAFTFTKKSGTTNPAADVPSTLELKLVDAFGHENVYKLPFTVKRAE